MKRVCGELLIMAVIRHYFVNRHPQDYTNAIKRILLSGCNPDLQRARYMGILHTAITLNQSSGVQISPGAPMIQSHIKR